MSKPAQLRETSDDQLEHLLRETQHNLFRLRLQSETERLEAPSEIIKAKREIARIMTILRLRQIDRENAAAASAPAPVVVAAPAVASGTLKATKPKAKAGAK
jgi:large subunit ribosomal protein L29